VKFSKRVERFCKRYILNILKKFLKPVPVQPEEFDTESISKILVIRQDSRLGNLILMTPLIRGLKTAFPDAELDVLISEGYEDVLSHNPYIDNTIVFEKRKARLLPWLYPLFIKSLRRAEYDIAIDVSNGYHFSLNNMLLTSLSGADYKIGYNRNDAQAFLNLLVPLPPPDMHMADAMLGLVKYVSTEVPEFPTAYFISDEDCSFADEWLKSHGIAELDSFFVIHPGGKGKKRWNENNFAGLIDRINADIGVKIIVIGGIAEHDTLVKIRDLSKVSFDVLENVTVGQMAAIIDRSNLFISGDTGPIHISSALGRPTIGIFISSDFRVYGPRGENARIVIGKQDQTSIEDVMIAVKDLFSNCA